jgi:hypothetical protein
VATRRLPVAKAAADCAAPLASVIDGHVSALWQLKLAVDPDVCAVEKARGRLTAGTRDGLRLLLRAKCVIDAAQRVALQPNATAVRGIVGMGNLHREIPEPPSEKIA